MKTIFWKFNNFRYELSGNWESGKFWSSSKNCWNPEQYSSKILKFGGQLSKISFTLLKIWKWNSKCETVWIFLAEFLNSERCRMTQAQLMRLDSFFFGALCVMSGGRLPAALFMVFLFDSKGAKVCKSCRYRKMLKN